jgi:hypothetical protein
MEDCSRVKQQIRCLLAHSTHDVRMTMTGGGHRVATIHIEPRFAAFIDEPRAAAPHRTHRETGVDRKKGGRLGRADGGK